MPVELLDIGTFAKSSAEAMTACVRASKRLQRMRARTRCQVRNATMQLRDEMLCCFLSAIQESTSLMELHMESPRVGEPANLAFENALTRTQSLRSLSLSCPDGLTEDMAVAAARSGLKNNTTLRELALECSWRATTVSPTLTSLRDHPLLRRLCVHGHAADLTGLETVLLSDNSKITELDIDAGLWIVRGEPRPTAKGSTRALRALGRRPTSLTKLRVRHCPLGRDEARQLAMVLRNSPNSQNLDLQCCALGSVGLSELAPALCSNASIKELDLSRNEIRVESAKLLRDIIRLNKTTTTLVLSGNYFDATPGSVECIAEGLGGNSAPASVDFSSWAPWN